MGKQIIMKKSRLEKMKIKYFKFFFMLFILSINNSCDPVTCRYCEETKVDFQRWINNKEFSLIESKDSTVEHKFILIDSSKTEAGEQCELGTSEEDVICDFYTIYNYDCESLNIKLHFQFKHSEYLENRFNLPIDLNLSITNKKYGHYYSYQIPIEDSLRFYKMKPEYLDSITFNNKTYYDVLELTKESIYKKTTFGDDKVFDKIYYSIHNGIISIEDSYLKH